MKERERGREKEGEREREIESERERKWKREREGEKKKVKERERKWKREEEIKTWPKRHLQFIISWKSFKIKGLFTFEIISKAFCINLYYKYIWKEVYSYTNIFLIIWYISVIWVDHC